VQTKSATGADGYDAVQVGLVDERPPKLKERPPSQCAGHFEKTGWRHSAHSHSQRVSFARRVGSLNVGDKILVDQFADGDLVDVVGKSKGSRFRRYRQTTQF
jgi:large subunit ribosomal protein L3